MIKGITIYKPNNAVEKYVLKKVMRQPNNPDGYFVTQIELISDSSVVVTFNNDKAIRYAGMPFETDEVIQVGKKKTEEKE